MKVTSAFAFALAAASAVSAIPKPETNAERLARGLPPLPPTRRSSGTVGQCNTGPIQCCNSLGKSTDGPIAAILKLLGVVVQDVTALIGLTCSPITVIGGGGNSCSSQPVCCSNNSFNGLIAIGCTPININL
ncbi:hydrophobin [Moniliophthora roreri MCA 2997]|uniref:Hydrophobin n=1 Tax=Moniliophthora roreri (strain MCA 2997) TaxID=1381753 RepID=V2Y8H6_MONRO|nr:hydrophobin [Moniliophthora roreri MCA 2997]